MVFRSASPFLGGYGGFGGYGLGYGLGGIGYERNLFVRTINMAMSVTILNSLKCCRYTSVHQSHHFIPHFGFGYGR